MRIVVTGGGTAGHVKPILAVTSEIKATHGSAEIVFIRQIGDSNTLDLLRNSNSIDKTIAIAAGKFRRYHGVSWQKQAIDVPTQLLNIRDAMFFVLGLVQSFGMLLLRRPDVVFVKGGYVGLPVGLSASLLRIPLVIHESDAQMGLTNRILSKYASVVGVGMPVENYRIGEAPINFVGVPISNDYKFVDTNLQKEYKKRLGIEPEQKVVVITGGSQGAGRVNNIVSAVSAKLAKEDYVIHQTGKETFEATKQAVESKLSEASLVNYKLLPFIKNDMHVYLGAADVVVSRVGTTTLAELAVSAKPLVLVPNPMLVYGHQIKNAEVYELANAAIVVDEELAIDDPTILYNAVADLLNSKEKSKELMTNLHKLAKPNAAKDIAKLILSRV